MVEQFQFISVYWLKMVDEKPQFYQWLLMFINASWLKNERKHSHIGWFINVYIMFINVYWPFNRILP
jgi:hypothetical protein